MFVGHHIVFNLVYNNLDYLYYKWVKFHANRFSSLGVVKAQTNTFLPHFDNMRIYENSVKFFGYYLDYIKNHFIYIFYNYRFIFKLFANYFNDRYTSFQFYLLNWQII